MHAATTWVRARRAARVCAADCGSSNESAAVVLSIVIPASAVRSRTRYLRNSIESATTSARPEMARAAVVTAMMITISLRLMGMSAKALGRSDGVWEGLLFNGPRDAQQFRAD